MWLFNLFSNGDLMQILAQRQRDSCFLFQCRTGKGNDDAFSILVVEIHIILS